MGGVRLAVKVRIYCDLVVLLGLWIRLGFGSGIVLGLS